MNTHKKILILSRFVKEYEPLRLKEEAQKAGLIADIIKYGQIEFGVNKNTSFIKLPDNKKISDYSYIVPRSASKKGSSMVAVKDIILQEAKKLNIPVLNEETFNKFPLLGKMEQGFLMSNNNIPTINYVSFGSKLGFKEYIKKVENITFPIIFKGRFGSHGKTILVANNVSELKEISSKYKGDSVLIQPLLKVKQWYRCIVVRDENNKYTYLGEMRHRQKNKYTHINYSHLNKKLVNLNSQKMAILNNICIQSAALFKCDYCGIDVLYLEDTQNFVVSEVNRTAQFKYFEKRVGVNVAKELIKR